MAEEKVDAADGQVETVKCKLMDFDAACAALAVILLDHIEQHLSSEGVISSQEIVAFSSALESIQNVYATTALRHGIKPDESCDAQKAIADALDKIEARRHCCG